MALVTYTFYTDTYYGEAIAEADFPRYDARAEDLILGLIKKTEEEAGALPASVLLAVQKAICAQIEYFLEYGLTLAVFGNTQIRSPFFQADGTDNLAAFLQFQGKGLLFTDEHVEDHPGFFQ